MYEKAKLDEAKFFFSQMSVNFDDRNKFTYNLSAFLSSARSVLQYALEEVKNMKGGQKRYDNHIAGSHTLKFFKDKRDINIHVQPIHPTQHVNVSLSANLSLRTSVSVVVKDASGNIKYQSPNDIYHHETKPSPEQKPAEVTVKYRFSDWAGSEDIMTLCQKYIDELENFIDDGMQKGFLMG